MRLLALVSCLLIFNLFLTQVSGLNTTRVSTFNVLCQACSLLEYDRWETRLGYMKDLMDRYSPDIIGVQELIDERNVRDFNELLPNHQALFFNHSRLPSYPDATIYYRKDVCFIYYLLFII